MRKFFNNEARQNEIMRLWSNGESDQAIKLFYEWTVTDIFSKREFADTIKALVQSKEG